MSRRAFMEFVDAAAFFRMPPPGFPTVSVRVGRELGVSTGKLLRAPAPWALKTHHLQI